MDDKCISQIFVISKIHYIQGKSSVTPGGAVRIFLCGLFILGLAGCSVTRSISQTDRGFLEQVLITQAIKSSLEHATEISLPTNSTVQIVAAGLTEDQYFATKIFESWLGRQGYRVLEEGADYKLRVIWHGIGTKHDEFFFGVPPISSTLIPVATPELSIYKDVREAAMARFSIDILKQGNGQLISSTFAYEGNVYFSVTTLLFGFTFESTNLVPPPM